MNMCAALTGRCHDFDGRKQQIGGDPTKLRYPTHSSAVALRLCNVLNQYQGGFPVLNRCVESSVSTRMLIKVAMVLLSL